MEVIPTNDARNFRCNCMTLQGDTCGPSNIKDDPTKGLPEYTHPTFLSFNTSTPILSRSSSTAQKENEPVTNDEAQDNTIKSSTAFEDYNQDISLATLETGPASTDDSRFRRISPEIRRFILFILMGIMFIPFSFAVRAWGNLDTNQTVGILQVSVIFFVELAKLFPWI